MARYSKNFERDWAFYINNRKRFNFSGSNAPDVGFDEKGVSAKKAFLFYDSQGKIKPTKEPNLLREIFITKASVNLHIKMWAKGRAEGTFPKQEFGNYMNEINAPEWVSEAVNRQVKKIYRREFPEFEKYV